MGGLWFRDDDLMPEPFLTEWLFTRVRALLKRYYT